MFGVFVKYRKYLIIGLLTKKLSRDMKAVSQLLNLRIQHLSKDVSELEKDGYIIKSKSKEKGRGNTKTIQLTKKGEEVREYFLRRKEELGLTGEEMKSYRGIL